MLRIIICRFDWAGSWFEVEGFRLERTEDYLLEYS
jgi:hypothetical protein